MNRRREDALKEERLKRTQEASRNNKRKERSSLNLSDKDFYKKELKGLNSSQKSKMLRKRKELIKKEKRKHESRKLNSARNPDEGADLDKNILKNPQENGQVSPNRRNYTKSRFRKVSNESLDEPLDAEDIKNRDAFKGTIAKLRRKNKRKKTKKRVKKSFQASVAIFGMPFVLGTIVLMASLLVFATISIGGIVSSVALSHPKVVLELYKNNMLAENTIVNTDKDVEDEDGNVIAQGIGSANTSGNFSYFGQFVDGTGTYTNIAGKLPSEGSGNGNDVTGEDVTEAPTDSVKGIIWNTLRKLGYSPEATAGVMGNIEQESTFNIRASNGTHSGLFQWDNVNRYKNATNYCKEQGKDITKDAICQVEFADKELKSQTFPQHAYSKNYSELKKSTSVKNVVYDFEMVFERSGQSAMENRLKYANQIYAEFKK